MTAPYLAFAAPAWRLDYLASLARPRRWSLLTIGNVTYLPPPIAAYRLRHGDGSAVLEMKPRAGPPQVIGRYLSGDAAREALKVIWRDHARPILPEIGAEA